MIRAVSILTMCAVVALLVGVHPGVVYAIALAITAIVLHEGSK